METEILKALIEEIALITGCECAQVKPDADLAENGIHSLGFIELLLAVKRRWQLDLTGGELGPEDVASVTALARRIEVGLQK